MHIMTKIVARIPSMLRMRCQFKAGNGCAYRSFFICIHVHVRISGLHPQPSCTHYQVITARILVLAWAILERFKWRRVLIYACIIVNIVLLLDWICDR